MPLKITPISTLVTLDPDWRDVIQVPDSQLLFAVHDLVLPRSLLEREQSEMRLVPRARVGPHASDAVAERELVSVEVGGDARVAAACGRQVLPRSSSQQPIELLLSDTPSDA